MATPVPGRRPSRPQAAGVGTNETSIAHRLHEKTTSHDDGGAAPLNPPEFHYPSDSGTGTTAAEPMSSYLGTRMTHAEEQELDVASLQELHSQTGPELVRTVTSLRTTRSERFKVVTWNIHTAKDLEGPIPDNPYEDPGYPPSWSMGKRWLISVIVITACTCGTTASSLTNTGEANLMHQLHISREVTTLGVTTFLVGLGTGIMWAPFSEFYGRRNIYILSLLAFALLNFPVAFANNPAVFFVFRFLTGLVVSSFVSVAGGTVTDLFPPQEVYLPLSIFSSAPFFGAVIAPIYSGFVNAFQTSYRWSFYALIIWAFVLWFLIIFCVPETYHPRILGLRAANLRKETGDDSWRTKQEIALEGVSVPRTIWNFVQRVPLLLVRDPMMLCLCIWSAFTLSVIYLFLVSFPLVFIRDRGFTLWEEGLAFLSVLIGMCMALCSVPLYFEPRYMKSFQECGGPPPPEVRLIPSMYGVILTSAGLWWFALVCFKSIHWIVPLLACVMFGAGFSLSYISNFTYTGDAYRSMSSSGLAANALVRCVAAGGIGTFGRQMYERMGTVGAGCFVAALTTLMVPIPFVFYKWGPAIRARSAYATSPGQDS